MLARGPQPPPLPLPLRRPFRPVRRYSRAWWRESTRRPGGEGAECKRWRVHLALLRECFGWKSGGRLRWKKEKKILKRIFPSFSPDPPIFEILGEKRALRTHARFLEFLRQPPPLQSTPQHGATTERRVPGSLLHPPVLARTRSLLRDTGRHIPSPRTPTRSGRDARTKILAQRFIPHHPAPRESVSSDGHTGASRPPPRGRSFA